MPDNSIPDTAGLARLSEDKRYFKAVSNYMANVLGIDRNAILHMLAEKIDARNPGQLVSEAVSKYFGTGADSNAAESIVKKQLDAAVDKYVKEAMNRSLCGWMDKVIQDRVDEIASRIPSPAPDVPAHRPNLSRYCQGAYLERPLIHEIIGSWLEKNLTGTDGVQFKAYLTPSGDARPYVNISGLSPDDAKAFGPLCGKDFRIIFGQATVPWKALLSLIAAELGWGTIDQAVACKDGIAVFAGPF